MFSRVVSSCLLLSLVVLGTPPIFGGYRQDSSIDSSSSLGSTDSLRLSPDLPNKPDPVDQDEDLRVSIRNALQHILTVSAQGDLEHLRKHACLELATSLKHVTAKSFKLKMKSQTARIGYPKVDSIISMSEEDNKIYSVQYGLEYPKIDYDSYINSYMIRETSTSWKLCSLYSTEYV